MALVIAGGVLVVILNTRPETRNKRGESGDAQLPDALGPEDANVVWGDTGITIVNKASADYDPSTFPRGTATEGIGDGVSSVADLIDCRGKVLVIAVTGGLRIKDKTFSHGQIVLHTLGDRYIAAPVGTRIKIDRRRHVLGRIYEPGFVVVGPGSRLPE
jgi:hypothetical protein